MQIEMSCQKFVETFTCERLKSTPTELIEEGLYYSRAVFNLLTGRHKEVAIELFATTEPLKRFIDAPRQGTVTLAILNGCLKNQLDLTRTPPPDTRLTRSAEPLIFGALIIQTHKPIPP